MLSGAHYRRIITSYNHTSGEIYSWSERRGAEKRARLSEKNSALAFVELGYHTVKRLLAGWLSEKRSADLVKEVHNFLCF